MTTENQNSLKRHLPGLFVLSAMLFVQSCGMLFGEEEEVFAEDFSLPGCENAWNRIDAAEGLDDLERLVRYNCPQLYDSGWRLKDGRFKREIRQYQACHNAWRVLEQKSQLPNVQFLITHNCPVFYRHGWIVPPQ